MKLNKWLSLASLFVLAGCGNYSTFTEPTAGVSIKYPKDWKLIEKSNGTIAAFISPKLSNIDAFQENSNLVIQDLSARPMTLEQYSKTAIDQLKKMFNNIDIVNEGPVTLAGKPAYRLEYIVKAEFNLRIIQIWTVVDKWSYMLTFSSDSDSYSKYSDIFNDMVKSFKILHGPQ